MRAKKSALQAGFWLFIGRIFASDGFGRNRRRKNPTLSVRYLKRKGAGIWTTGR